MVQEYGNNGNSNVAVLTCFPAKIKPVRLGRLRLRQSGQLGNVEYRKTDLQFLGNLMQKNNIIFPFFDLHGVTRKFGKLSRQVGQLVVMRGKQAATFDCVVQIFKRSPCNRKARHRLPFLDQFHWDDKRTRCGLF